MEFPRNCVVVENHNTSAVIMFEARLPQGKIVKLIVEAMKDLVSEGNIDCTKSGIAMQVSVSQMIALYFIIILYNSQWTDLMYLWYRYFFARKALSTIDAIGISLSASKRPHFPKS